MYKGIILIATLFYVATVLVQQTNAVCGACEANSVACINETAFHNCFLGIADTTQTFSCPSGQVCSRNVDEKCTDAKNAANALSCTPFKGCGVCSSEAMFVCTSRTTFAQCNGNRRIDTGVCPEGLFCSASTNGPICGQDIYDCDNEIEII